MASAARKKTRTTTRTMTRTTRTTTKTMTTTRRRRRRRGKSPKRYSCRWQPRLRVLGERVELVLERVEQEVEAYATSMPEHEQVRHQLAEAAHAGRATAPNGLGNHLKCVAEREYPGPVGRGREPHAVRLARGPSLALKVGCSPGGLVGRCHLFCLREEPSTHCHHSGRRA